MPDVNEIPVGDEQESADQFATAVEDLLDYASDHIAKAKEMVRDEGCVVREQVLEAVERLNQVLALYDDEDEEPSGDSPTAKPSA